jgi:hypothetical protein
MSTPTRGTGDSRRERAAALRAAQQRAQRRRRAMIWAAVVIVLLGAAGIITGIAVSSSSGSKKQAAGQTGQLGPEGIVLEEGNALAPNTTAAKGATVQGVQCNSGEQVAYHIHTHLAVYVNGVLRPISPGIGTVAPVAQQTPNGVFYSASSCYYWLHVHAQDGVIHVESPTNTKYTLGQFFAIWGQPLSKTQVGPATGKLTVYVNGKQYTGDPTAIPLGSREDIQIDVGTPVPPKVVDWSQSQL